ncbi:MAG: hypothetical protein EOO28_05695 [Comamonadaceae bacterium]|nr:MAG: hypothetical protein EOO28_05695 [Comamonadaceae bacterium]
MAAAMACSAPLAFAVNPVTGPAAQVALCIGPHNQGVFNPLTAYPDPIRYGPASERLKLTIKGNFYSLDVTAAAEEAMAEWMAAIPGLRFQRVPVYEMTPETLRLQVDFNNRIGALGAGFKAGSPTTDGVPVLAFFVQSFLDMAADDVFDSNRPFLAATTMDDYLAFLLKMTAKHELGHVLGFMHTPVQMAGDHVTADTAACPGTAYFTPTDIAAGPPIMAPNLQVALRLMRDYHGRPVTLADIQIAPQEAAVGRGAFAQDCPRTRQELAARGAGTGRSLNCLTPTSIVYPSLPAVRQLLD